MKKFYLKYPLIIVATKKDKNQPMFSVLKVSIMTVGEFHGVSCKFKLFSCITENKLKRSFNMYSYAVS